MITDEVVELRDVFPTFYDLAGGNMTKYAFDGQSTMDIQRGKEYRENVDMEMSACWMNKTIVWNGFINKKWKYIYWACEQREELFDLVNDPNEMTDLSTQKPDLVTLYRQMLIDQFKEEGRDSRFLKDGKLNKRCYGINYSPNQPPVPSNITEIYYYHD